jgi:hypothetical protein
MVEIHEPIQKVEPKLMLEQLQIMKTTLENLVSVEIHLVSIIVAVVVVAIMVVQDQVMLLVRVQAVHLLSLVMMDV